MMAIGSDVVSTIVSIWRVCNAYAYKAWPFYPNIYNTVVSTVAQWRCKLHYSVVVYDLVARE